MLVDDTGDLTTIPAALRSAAGRHADRLAVSAPTGGAGTPLSWGELADHALRGAGALVELGVAPGDRVALWGANSVEWVTASLSVLCAAAVVVPVNSRYRLEEASDIVTRARCAVVLADGPGPGDADAPASPAEQLDSLPGVDHVVTLEGRAIESVPSWAALVGGVTSAPAEVEHRIRALQPDDVSHVQFTSGTTGRPKGALLTHGAMVATTASWAQIVGLAAGDRYPVIAPFSHVAGHKSGILASVVAGATMRPVRAFDADALADLVARGDASFLQGAPAMFGALLGALERRGLSATGVRTVVAGASVVPPALVRRLRAGLGVAAVLNGYGLSEATGVCTITRRDDPEEVVTSTCGRPVPGVEIRVVGPDGTPVGTGGAGEVEVRGINVMRGYLDDPEATAQVMHDGWLRTGDVGTVDPAGNLRIVDRLKDLLVVGGFNVSPAEIERVLGEDPAVADVAVVGAPDDKMGEVPVAFVVPAGDGPLDAPAVQARVAERLAGFKVPRRYETVPSLPVTAAGKVDKRALRALLAGGGDAGADRADGA